jgi:hypothetical protein
MGKERLELLMWKFGWGERDPRFFLELGKRHSLVGLTGNRTATTKKGVSLLKARVAREMERGRG